MTAPNVIRNASFIQILLDTDILQKRLIFKSLLPQQLTFLKELFVNLNNLMTYDDLLRSKLGKHKRLISRLARQKDNFNSLNASIKRNKNPVLHVLSIIEKPLRKLVKDALLTQSAD